MHVAALVDGLGQDLLDRPAQAGMVVGDDEFDPCKAAGLEAEQELLPARAALAVGELDAEHLTPAFPIDADRLQDSLAADHAILSDLLPRVGRRAARGQAPRASRIR